MDLASLFSGTYARLYVLWAEHEKQTLLKMISAFGEVVH